MLRGRAEQIPGLRAFSIHLGAIGIIAKGTKIVDNTAERVIGFVIRIEPRLRILAERLGRGVGKWSKKAVVGSKG